MRQLRQLIEVASNRAKLGDRPTLLDSPRIVAVRCGAQEQAEGTVAAASFIAQNCWLFGEEHNLSVDDKSLTEVLRKHRKLIGDDTVIDEPVKHVSKERGIVDLMFSRAIKRHEVDDLTQLIVEPEAPKVPIDQKVVLQIEGYAISVMSDERFKGVKSNWSFWVISDMGTMPSIE